jgi:tetratricopeptide (TPR) repeat protein
MPAARQSIRVFISSTFRDMHAERDHLVKFVFPQLRRLCESRGVTWGEVDLRWGVTDEQVAEGEVLPICLEEIRRCRPYFIGLLGERYGWVPDSLPPKLLESEPWLREHLAEKVSVTELEVLHGVLRNSTMAGHVFFYFRDPRYAMEQPAAHRADFLSTDAASSAKLRNLKERIRGSGLPVRENYPTPKALGDLVLRDMTAVIDRLYPEGSRPDPLDREAMDHAAYARSRARVYIGRDEYFQRLDAYAAGNSDKPLAVLGASGSGKSALLANWVLCYQQQHPGALVIQHFIGASPYSADWIAMVGRILGELSRKLHIDRPTPRTPEDLRSALKALLALAGGRDPVVLVLDSLNRLEDKDNALDLPWLPELLAPNVRVLASTLPGKALDEIIRRKWPVFEIQPLNPAERQQLISEYLHHEARSLSPERLARIASAPSCANPLYLRVLLEELRVTADNQTLGERIDSYLQAKSPYELYERLIARWESDYDLVGDTLSLVWAARNGLSETELLQALGTADRPLARAQWSPLFLAIGDGLVSRSGLLTFAHDYLRTAVRDVYLPTASLQQAAHIRLADYFERQPASPRRMDELPWQLCEGKQWERLVALLADRDSFKQLWARNEFALRTYWATIEASSPFRMTQAYRPQIENPQAEAEEMFLNRLDLLLGTTGHPEEASRLSSALVKHYRRTGDLDGLSVSLENQASILNARGDLDGAMSLLKEDERICRQLGNLDGLSAALGDQALILHARGDLVGAMTLHQEEERLCRQLGNLQGLSRALGNRAVILHARGELDEAMTLHKEEERICRQLGNLARLQESLGNQANVLDARGDMDGAMALHKEAERICRQLGNLSQLATILGNQAVILQTRGDLDGAMTLHQEEERICRQLGNLEGLSRALGNQAVILHARGNLGGAMTLLREQERLCRQLGNLHGLQATLGNQGAILQLRGDLNEAMPLYKEAERICRQLTNTEGLASSLANQALLLKQMGRADEGLPLAEEAYQLAITHGYAALARQFEAILSAVRQAAQSL